jgi:ketopantoate reductase
LVDVKVTVIGAGGVGGYFGGRLLQAGVDVTFVARGAHLDALKADGLHVRSVRVTSRSRSERPRIPGRVARLTTCWCP